MKMRRNAGSRRLSWANLVRLTDSVRDDDAKAFFTAADSLAQPHVSEASSQPVDFGRSGGRFFPVGESDYLLRLRKTKFSAQMPQVARQPRRGPFQIGWNWFVSFFCQFRRDGRSPLGVEESHVLAIDLLAFLGGRIRTRDVETAVLHEVVVGIATVRFSATRQSARSTLSSERPCSSFDRDLAWTCSTHSSKSRASSGDESRKPSHQTTSASKANATAATGHFLAPSPGNRAYAYFPICSLIERKNAGVFCGQTHPSM